MIPTPPPPNAADGGSTVIAVKGGRHCLFAVQWAVEHLLEWNSSCVLVHVRSQNLDPHDTPVDSKHGRPATEEELHRYFLPYRGFCAQKGIVVEELVLYDNDVTRALTYFVNENHISNVVVGASQRNPLLRRLKHADVPINLTKSLPQFCTIYVVSKGKVQNIRPNGHHQNIKGSTTTVAREDINSVLHESLLDHPSKVTPNVSEDINRKPSKNRIKRESSKSNENISITISPPRGRRLSQQHSSSRNLSSQSPPTNSDSSSLVDVDEFIDMSNGSSNNSKHRSPSNPKKRLDAEIRKLKRDLKKTTEQYGMACKEVESAKHLAMELEKFKLEKERNIEKAKLVEAPGKELERQKTKKPPLLAEKEKQAEIIRGSNDREEEEQRALSTEVYSPVPYRRYDIKEIEAATNYFDEALLIGEGGYGPVFRGVLDHTVVAIKVVRPDLAHGERQFQQEVDVLSSIRHPHMVLLLGACPEFGCLVYEYMDNGSLEDRLFRKDNTRPIPWKARFSIASQVATCLLFLHQTKPKPLVHRDLKPANILLDRTYVSKIGDVGLARLVPPSVANKTTQYRMTAAAGTICYIDPEYQQTGKLGVKSDIYSFGVMLLQILTAKSPMSLPHLIDKAIKDGKFTDVLDPSLTDWPIEEALSCAKLALKCCELRKRDRPDLATVILPELNRLRDLGRATATDNGSSTLWKKLYEDGINDPRTPIS